MPPLVSPDANRRDADAGIASLTRVASDLLSKNNRPGSIIVRVNCDRPGLADRRVPADRVSNNSDWKGALTQLLAGERDLSWEESGGLVRVVDKSIDSDFLKVRLKNFRVRSTTGTYGVVNDLWNAPEVLAFIQSHSIQRFQRPSRIWAESSPITIHMMDASVSDILDESAKRFKGIWVYVECKDKEGRRVDFDLVQF